VTDRAGAGSTDRPDSSDPPEPSASTASPAIALRRGTADDSEGIADVYLASFHATYEFSLAHTDGEVRAWIRASVVGGAETWVATDQDGGPVVGMMMLAPGDLDQLYVAPDRIGQGIGRRLLERAKERSPAGLRLYTFQVNARARRFYERNGFVTEELGDGTGNEEGQPDIRYAWRPDTS
jgi:GNAT superfamily N-acetyltransferase